MADDDGATVEDVTGKEWCPACGNHHDENVRPMICHNLLSLTEAVREFVEQGDEESARALGKACDDILGEETVDDDEDDEVFN